MMCEIHGPRASGHHEFRWGTSRQSMIRTYITTWLLCFSLASINSSLISTDSSPVSTDSFLLAFLLLEPSPFNTNTQWNVFCSVLLYHFIYFKYKYLSEKIHQFSEHLCPWKMQLTQFPGFPHLNSMPQAIDCDPQAVTGVSQVL